MVIEMAKHRNATPPDADARQGQVLDRGVNVRFTAAQHRGLELLAQQRGESVSEVLRLAVEAYLAGYRNGDGVTLLQQLELDLAQESVAASQLARHFGLASNA